MAFVVNTSMSDEYLNVEMDGKNGEPTAVAAVFESLAESVREAPEGKRYDFNLKVNERE